MTRNGHVPADAPERAERETLDVVDLLCPCGQEWETIVWEGEPETPFCPNCDGPGIRA